MRHLGTMLSLLLACGTPAFAGQHSELFQSYSKTTEQQQKKKKSAPVSKNRPVQRVGYNDLGSQNVFFGDPINSNVYEESPSKQKSSQELRAFIANPAMARVRGGGNSGRALGIYRDGLPSIVFNCKEYVELPEDIKAHWAVYLYTIVEAFHGGWQSTLNSRYLDPIAASYVEYDKLDFAATMFFQKHDEFHDPGNKYARLSGQSASAFRKDAILDAINMIGTISYSLAKNDTERRVVWAWTNGTIDRYQRQIGAEGHVETVNPAWKPPVPAYRQSPRETIEYLHDGKPVPNPYQRHRRGLDPSPFAPGASPASPGYTSPSQPTTPRNVPKNPFDP